MLTCLQRAFEIMNWFAGGDHHCMEGKDGKKLLRFGRTDHESVLAEVYGVIASGFEPFRKAVENTKRGNTMFEISLKIDKKTKATLDKKLKKHRETADSNAEYEASMVRNYVSLIARAAYNLGQQDIKLPAQDDSN